MSSSTKDRILDAAEILFASEGYHCTSLRTLTRIAEVNLAAVNYHFGSKEALVEALMDRRLQPLTRRREERLALELETARKEDRHPDAGQVLRAFIEPTLDFSKSDPGPRHFVAFISRILIEPDDDLRSLFLQRVRPHVGRFYNALRLALPDVSPSDLFMRLQFTIGLLSHTICSMERLTGKSREFPLPDGVEPLSGSQELCERILAFVLPGMEVT